MKKFLFILSSLILLGVTVQAEPLTGGVTEVGLGNKVVDAKTNAPISGAQVSLPKQGYKTYTDSDGNFNLNADINGDTIMSVNKSGYRPFSITIDKNIASKPMVLGIQKSDSMDVVIDSEMLHLGDDNFSKESANAGEFRLQAIGPTYVKSFMMTANTLAYNNFLIIGSIIGIDTKMARELKQNQIQNSYASPPEVFFNGRKIAEIQLNGDNQRIKLPRALIRPDQLNEIVIKTGINLFQRAYTDYDDIELMNLSIQTE